MRTWTSRITGVSLAVLCAAGPALADTIPHYSVDTMCDRAHLIVEAKHLGGDRVKIVRTHKPSPHLEADTTEISVVQLGKHNRRLGIGAMRGEGQVIKTDRLVLFLTFVHGYGQFKNHGRWHALSTDSRDALCGSCGVFWFDDKACYGYVQSLNPGPYVLRRGGRIRRIPKDIAALREGIRIGLMNSKRWRAALALEGPAEKARALARYLLRRTSPEGDCGSFQYEVRHHLPKLGAHAVPPLLAMLKNARPEDRLNGVVLILYDIGRPAAPAVPALCRLLKAPDKQAAAVYVLAALQTAGDPAAIEHVWPFLKDERWRVVERAAETLGVLGDRASFDAIAAHIPERIDPTNRFPTMTLLRALYRLDPERTRPIILQKVGARELADIQASTTRR